MRSGSLKPSAPMMNDVAARLKRKPSASITSDNKTKSADRKRRRPRQSSGFSAYRRFGITT